MDHSLIISTPLYRRRKMNVDMDEPQHQRPLKYQRIASPIQHKYHSADADADAEEDADDVDRIALQLQRLVHQLSQIPLSRYCNIKISETTSTNNNNNNIVDGVVHNMRIVLEQATECTDRQLVFQMHGLLLQWLDYVVTSLPMRDITSTTTTSTMENDHDDYEESSSRPHNSNDNTNGVDVVQSTKYTVNAICACLDELYRCSPWNLLSYEVLYIVVRALLTLTTSDDQQYTTETAQDEEHSSLSELFRILEVTLQYVDVRQLPLCLQQHLILRLVEMSDNDNANDDNEYRDRCSITASESAGSLLLLSAAARNILHQMAVTTIHPTSATTAVVEPAYAQTALAVVVFSPTDSNNTSFRLSTMIPRPVNANQLFGFQCLLRRQRLSLFCHPEDAIDLIPSLVEFVRLESSSGGSTVRYQALDCLVTMALRVGVDDQQQILYSHQQKQASAQRLCTALTQALVSILIELRPSHDLFLRIKAVEGLQHVLSNDERVLICMDYVTRNSNRNDMLKQFVSSLHEIVVTYPRDGLFRDTAATNVWGEYEHVMVFTQTNAVVVAACEILLSVICFSLESTTRSTNMLSDAQIVTVCESLLRYPSHCEHIVYLTVRTICNECRDAFFAMVQTYPELLSSLARVVVSTNDISATTIQSILGFFQDLVQERPMLSTVLARLPSVLESVATVATPTSLYNHRNNIAPSSREAMRQQAVFLLHTLSSEVCNRRILARQGRVLSSMIHFMRDHTGTGTGVHQRGNTTTSETSTATIVSQHRERLKQTILQLAAVL